MTTKSNGNIYDFYVTQYHIRIHGFVVNFAL